MSTRSNLTTCWDTSVVLALINGEEGRSGHCESLIQSAASERIRIYVSAIVIPECNGGSKLLAKDQVELDELNRKVLGFFEHKFIRVAHVDPIIGDLSRRLQQQCSKELNHFLPLADSVHLATAISTRSDVLHTYDTTDLIPLSEQKLSGLPSLPKIEAPNDPYWPQLPGVD